MGLHLLGGLTFTDAGGQPVNTPTRKTSLVLAVLALSQGRNLARDTLAEWVWPDRQESQARTSLRQALTAIRRCLPTAAAGAEIVSDGDVLRLEGAEVHLDISRFEALAASGTPEGAREAADLYAGDLLAGITLTESIEPLVMTQREHLRGLAIRLVEELSLECGDNPGHVANCEGLASRLLLTDPADEAAHRALIRIYLAAGRRDAAARQLKRCEDALRDALGVAPDSVTRALLEDGRSEFPAGSDSPMPGPPASGPSASNSLGDSIAIDVLKRPALLVMPFENQSADPEQDYFVRGVTDDVIMALSYWRWFPIIGANTIARDRDGKTPDLRTAAAGVDARYVLTGSVRRSGDRARVAVQLVDGESGHTIWAERFERSMDDVFTLQDEISEKVVGGVEPQIRKAESQRIRYKRANDRASWELLLEAAEKEREGGSGYGTPDINEAVRQILARAVAVNPPPALAYAMLARCDWKDVIMGWREDRDAAIASALANAQRSFDLNPDNWEGRATYALVQLFGRYDAPAAREHAEIGVRLNPSAAAAQHAYGCVLEFSGEPERALKHLHAAFRVDPDYRNGAAALADVTMCNLMLGRFDEATAAAERCRAMAPAYVRGLHRYIAAMALAGRREDARNGLNDLLERQPDLSREYIETTYPFVLPEHRQLLLDGLIKAGWNV